MRPPLERLTDRQLEIYHFIWRYLEANCCPPSYREMMAALDIASPNGISCNLMALERKGFITGARQIGCVKDGRPFHSRQIRLVGVRCRLELENPVEAV